MVERVEKVTREVDSSNTVEPTRSSTEVREVHEASPSGTTVAERIIWFVASVLLVLLAFRFILTLLGANPNNQFANFIYETSYPFVAPFFNLFGYDLEYGIARVEVFTLVAMAVYVVIAWGLAKLVTIGRAERS